MPTESTETGKWSWPEEVDGSKMQALVCPDVLNGDPGVMKGAFGRDRTGCSTIITAELRGGYSFSDLGLVVFANGGSSGFSSSKDLIICIVHPDSEGDKQRFEGIKADFVELRRRPQKDEKDKVTRENIHLYYAELLSTRQLKIRAVNPDGTIEGSEPEDSAECAAS